MLCEVMAGNGVEATVAFTDASGAAADPTTASVVVRQPDGTETTYTSELTHVGVGVYTLTFAPATPGRWYVKGVGTGNVVAVDEDYVLVMPTVA